MRPSTRITAMPPADSGPLVAVLAAGGATRFGGGKLDALCAGKPVGAWVLDAAEAAGLAAGVIVVGDDAPLFALASGWQVIINHDAAAGLGTSLALAARHAMQAERDLLVLLADMPLISCAFLLELAAAKRLAGTQYPGGKTGVPALLPLALLAELKGLAGDSGAGALLSGQAQVQRLSPPPEMLIDIDTPADLARAEALLIRRA